MPPLASTGSEGTALEKAPSDEGAEANRERSSPMGVANATYASPVVLLIWVRYFGPEQFLGAEHDSPTRRGSPVGMPNRKVCKSYRGTSSGRTSGATALDSNSNCMSIHIVGRGAPQARIAAREVWRIARCGVRNPMWELKSAS